MRRKERRHRSTEHGSDKWQRQLGLHQIGALNSSHVNTSKENLHSREQGKRNRGNEETAGGVDIIEVTRTILCNYIISRTIFCKRDAEVWHFAGIVKTTIYNNAHK
jgi:hypothetical protein